VLCAASFYEVWFREIGPPGLYRYSPDSLAGATAERVHRGVRVEFLSRARGNFHRDIVSKHGFTSFVRRETPSSYFPTLAMINNRILAQSTFAHTRLPHTDVFSSYQLADIYQFTERTVKDVQLIKLSEGL